MATEERTIPISQFRDQCLRLMDEINETGDALIVTKHGRPITIVGPARRDKGSLWGFMKGTTRILGDIDSPAIPPDDWDIVSNPDRVLNPSSVPSA